MPHTPIANTSQINTIYSGLLASCRIAILLYSLILPGAALAQDSSNPQPFPNLTFKDETGATHSLSAEKGKLTLVHFWATWCAPCVKEFPEIDALQKAYASKGLKVIAISLDGQNSATNVKAFYTAHNITNLKIYLDGVSDVSEAHIKGMPTSFFINSDGLNINTIEGPADWMSADIKSFLDKNLK